MELFEDGGNVDEVSGNEIPLGSTASEVRDDQPAMLSEGEMVIPADVVRYFGVEHFMNLRDQAKMGYKKMEAMGQFGTEEGQTLPDDTIFNAGGPPFTIEDIEVIEDYEENEAEEKEPIKAAKGKILLPEDDSDGNTDLIDSTPPIQSLSGKPAFTMQNVKDIVGVDTFEFLQGFMPKSIINNATEEEKSAIENYENNVVSNYGISTAPTEGGGEPSGDGQTGSVSTTNTISNAPGTGSIQELMSYPTNSNVQGLKDFGNLLNSELGKAALQGFGWLTSLAINPGQVAPVVGLVQRGVGMAEKALLGPDAKIAKGFAELRDIPTIQANIANRAVRSFEYDISELSDEQKGDINTIAEAMEIADAQNIDINDPNTVVSITDRGETVVSRGGKYGAHFNRNGDIVGDPRTAVPKDKVKETVEKVKEIGNNMATRSHPDTDYSKEDPGQTQFGGWGGPTSGAEAAGLSGPVADVSGAMTANFGLPDDDDIEEDNKPDYGGFTGAESVLGDTNQSNINSNLEAFDYGNDGATGNTGNVGGMEEGFDVADAMGGNAGGNDGTADSSGSDGISDDAGSGFKHGGFVHKRKYKKKKKRRGLAGR